MKENTELAVLIGKMLGNVGLLHDEMKQVHEKLPALKADLELVAESASLRLAAAAADAVRNAQAAGKAAGAEAIERAAGEQVKALVSRMALVSDDLRVTANEASASLRRAVEKVSIWRQVSFCAGSGIIAALLVCLLIWLFGAKITVEGCPATLSSDQCGIYLDGVAMEKMWPKLPKQIQEYLKTVNKAVE